MNTKQPTTPGNLAVRQIGSVALQQLAETTRATVVGVTSRGVFMRLGAGGILFCSYEPYAGPLTLNLFPPHRMEGCQVGDTGEIRAGQLHLPSSSHVLAFGQAQVWLPPAPAHVLDSQPIDRLLEVVKRILASGYDGFSGVLPGLLRLERSNSLALPLPALAPGPEKASSITEAVLDLRQALRVSDLPAMLASAARLVGVGPGLTPSGDDLLCGLLLTLFRWRMRLNTDFLLSDFSAGILDLARPGTTALSTALLACAAQGQADERLIVALDGLFTGNPGTEACASLLLQWGSSSGCDALVGMTLALTTLEM